MYQWFKEKARAAVITTAGAVSGSAAASASMLAVAVYTVSYVLPSVAQPYAIPATTAMVVYYQPQGGWLARLNPAYQVGRSVGERATESALDNMGSLVVYLYNKASSMTTGLIVKPDEQELADTSPRHPIPEIF